MLPAIMENTMRIWLAMALILLAAGARADYTGVWKGSLGQQPIEACFNDDGNGHYFYTKYGKSISLKQPDKDMQGQWYEGKKKNPTGGWTLPPPQGDSILGTWRNRQGRYPLTLIRLSHGTCASDEFRHDLAAARTAAAKPATAPSTAPSPTATTTATDTTASTDTDPDETCGDAEEKQIPQLVAEGRTAADFVPKDWVLDEGSELEEDFDGDGHNDLAFSLTDNNPALKCKHFGQDFDQNPSMIVVLLGKPGGGYRLLVADSTIVPQPQTNMDPPFDGIKSHKGVLEVDLHYFMNAGGWDMGNTSFKFRYDKGCMRLIGYDNLNHNRASGDEDETSINTASGKAHLTHTPGGGGQGNDGQGNDAQGAVEQASSNWVRLKQNPHICLGKVSDGDGFSFDATTVFGLSQ